MEPSETPEKPKLKKKHIVWALAIFCAIALIFSAAYWAGTQIPLPVQREAPPPETVRVQDPTPLLQETQPPTLPPATAATDAPTEAEPSAETEPSVVPDPELPTVSYNASSYPMVVVKEFAKAHGLSLSDYPENILNMLYWNMEAEDFVLYYPLEHDQPHEVDMSEFEDTEGIPLFIQWDRRWGYKRYGTKVAGLNACGPLCMSMVAYYLTGGDPETTPDKVIDYALSHGFYLEGQGTYWSFMTKGAEHYGLKAKQISNTKKNIMENLEAGHPLICIMGPGVFTSSGHFVVMVGCSDGYIQINDPNSYIRSGEIWDYDSIRSQIEGVWVYEKAEE